MPRSELKAQIRRIPSKSEVVDRKKSQNAIKSLKNGYELKLLDF